MRDVNEGAGRFVGQQLVWLLVCLLFVASCVGCVQETKSKKVTLLPPRQSRPTPKTTQERSPGPIPGLVAVMLDPSPYLPSVHSEKGLDSLLNALRDNGITGFAVSSWDELSQRQGDTMGAKAALVVVVSFQDLPNLNTFGDEAQKCSCKFAGRVVQIGTGIVLQQKEMEHEGAPGSDYEEACLDAVAGVAKLYAEAAAETIKNYTAGGVEAARD